MRPIAAIRKLASKMMPWPSRRERREAIAAAAAEHATSREAGARARETEQQIKAMMRQDHWAAIVAEGLGIPDRDRNGGKK